MKKVIAAGLLVVMLAAVLVGCLCSENEGDQLPPYDYPYLNGGFYENGGETVEPTDYSSFIGTWQGYAIAVTETVVITGVEGNNVEFHFFYISSMDGSETVGETRNLPIVDGQITVVEERIAWDETPFTQTRTLTFEDDRIVLSIVFDDDDWGTEWILTRVEE